MMESPLEEGWLFRRTGIGPEELDFLGQVPLFAGLTRAQLALLMSDASVRRYGGGTTLFYQEEAAKNLFVIFEGWVKATTALASVTTAVLLWPLLPRVVALPSPQVLRRASRQLADEADPGRGPVGGPAAVAGTAGGPRSRSRAARRGCAAPRPTARPRRRVRPRTGSAWPRRAAPRGR